jgi:putative intracellular protease/amidase
MTTAHSERHVRTQQAQARRPCALLWEESFLWGVIARRALQEAGLPFDLLRAADLRAGALDRYRLLFVPGGWASGKARSLGPEGREAIRRFVAAGGSYLGICGGAGLATRDGLGLLAVTRKPGSERVPSFSGPIRVVTEEPLLIRGTAAPVFHAWWPSQFAVEDPAVRILATYREPQAGALSADIPIEEGAAQGWAALEARYGIRLDPGRLAGEPAVVAGHLGLGRVILSLLHFDTPGDANGAAVLKNLWEALALGGEATPAVLPERKADKGLSREPVPAELPGEAGAALAALEAAVGELVAAGQRLGLWQWRTPWLLRWRRGVRGLEASALAVLIGEIRSCLARPHRLRGAGRPGSQQSPNARLTAELDGIRCLLAPFIEQAALLLAAEAGCLRNGPLAPLAGGNEEILRLRQELYGSGMSHGGQFKRILDALDAVLWPLIRT